MDERWAGWERCGHRQPKCKSLSWGSYLVDADITGRDSSVMENERRKIAMNRDEISVGHQSL